ncbi:MAG TPA: c-type cytochrome [Bryobacteraceae bacterium]
MRLLYLLPFGLAVAMTAQTPRPARPPGFVRPSAYPERAPADPAVVARGKATFGVHCSFCHGSDARGGEGGPNLIRSELVLNDKNGEKIAPVVQNGRPDRGMPKFDLSAASISDIATYIHSFKVGGYDVSRQKPISILVGDAKAGETYFSAKCASCHSVTGDLKGIGAKFDDPKVLQQTWLAPGGAGRRGPAVQASAVPVKPVTVTVTLPSGEKTEGQLVRIDDFIVTLTNADGTQSSFRRDGDSPKVEVHDPSQPHRDLLATYTDKDIHNLTAYLVTLK